MDDLARRIEAEGPLAARDAVRLAARLARAIEALHATGAVHGRLGPRAVVLPGPRLAQARLLPAARCVEDPEFQSPERRERGAPASRADDAFAIARTLHFALTQHKPAPPEVALPRASARPPPLAVFDAGDDSLEEILDAALSLEPAARPGDLRAFRLDLDRWLEKEGAGVDDALPYLEGSMPGEREVDLSSLPPPPAPEGGAKAVPKEPSPYDLSDEDSTWRQAERGDRSGLLRVAPRLVPPKITRPRSGPPPLPSATPPVAGLDDEARPTLPRAEVPASAPSRPAAPLAFLFVGVAALLVVAIFYVAVDPLRGASPVGSSAGAGSAPIESSASPERPSASGAPSASAPPPIASTPRDSPPPVDPAPCLRTLFPADTFGDERPDLGFVCLEHNPVVGAPRVRERVVLAGGGKVSGGMKEWAVLGFYELAAYAALRARCCPGAPPLELPPPPGSCPRLELSLAELARVAAPGSSDVDVDRAIHDFDKAVRCITRSKQTLAFGGHPRPSGGEGTTLKKTLSRAREAPP